MPRKKSDDGAARQASSHAVSAACQNMRHIGAEPIPAASGLGEEGEFLDEYVAGFQVWNSQDVCVSGNRRLDTFDSRCFVIG
jgi:hypothetical protein